MNGAGVLPGVLDLSGPCAGAFHEGPDAMYARGALKRALACGLVVLVSLLVCRCTGLFSTNIGDIRNNPRHYADKEVAISGEVSGTFSLVVIKYFTLRDSTGEITVVTQRPLPKEGQHLKVKGVVREAFSIGAESLLVIVEEPERAKQSG